MISTLLFFVAYLTNKSYCVEDIEDTMHIQNLFGEPRWDNYLKIKIISQYYTHKFYALSYVSGDSCLAHSSLRKCTSLPGKSLELRSSDL